MPPTVSFVIVNYNGESCLPACLDSIFAQTRPPDEVIVVDNASQDGSLELLERNLAGRGESIALPRNLGYAGACNRGIEKCSAELIAVLNNDIVLDRHWLESLLAHDHADFHFWASRILFAANPDLVDSAGDGMAVIGAAYKIGHGDPASRFDKPREVFGPCGAAALYRREVLEATGGFDADFFLVYEDADLSMRARLRGFRCLYVPSAKVYHRVNTSIGTLSASYVFFGQRNSEYVFWKNMPTTLLLLYLPERILFDLISFLFFLAKGRGKAYLRAKQDFIRTLPHLMEKRRQVQQTRQLQSRQLNRLLDRNWVKYRKNAVSKL
ncbi:MAG: glycosyltransferase family 2 protein [Acidobacteriota bacterium]